MIPDASSSSVSQLSRVIRGFVRWKNVIIVSILRNFSFIFRFWFGENERV
jgi:hypothetical protein